MSVLKISLLYIISTHFVWYFSAIHSFGLLDCVVWQICLYIWLRCAKFCSWFWHFSIVYGISLVWKAPCVSAPVVQFVDEVLHFGKVSLQVVFRVWSSRSPATWLSLQTKPMTCAFKAGSHDGDSSSFMLVFVFVKEPLLLWDAAVSGDTRPLLRLWPQLVHPALLCYQINDRGR